MNVKITAYLDGMAKVQRAAKKKRRRERAWQNAGIIAIVVSVIVIAWSTVHLIATAAW